MKKLLLISLLFFTSTVFASVRCPTSADIKNLSVQEIFPYYQDIYLAVTDEVRITDFQGRQFDWMFAVMSYDVTGNTPSDFAEANKAFKQAKLEHTYATLNSNGYYQCEYGYDRGVVYAVMSPK